MLPKVAIVGRPNVGKSSLLNMLARKRISIVEPTAGVTRDRVSFDLELPSAGAEGAARWCELVDTGGYGVYSEGDELAPLTADVERQIAFAVDEAALILFVVDGQAGLTPLDKQLARKLREQIADPSRLVLLANKVDDESHEAAAMEAAALGLGDPLSVSATAGRGRDALLRRIADALAPFEAAAPAEPEMKLAIVGQRNAGKSTLVNALAQDDRVIASELPGTTRDSVDVRFELDGRTFTAMDTAGVRKRKSVKTDVEYYSTHRALRAIRRADVVLLLLDATDRVSRVDKKLSQEIAEHYKPCVIAVNKWDLAEQRAAPEDYLKYLNEQLKGLQHAPIAFVSAATGEGLEEAIHTACDLHEAAGRRVATGPLNKALERIFAERGPSPRLGKQAKVYYGTQVAARPPTIAVFVNDPDHFTEQYRRYLLNRLAEQFGWEEVPIKLHVRSRRKADEAAEAPAG